MPRQARSACPARGQRDAGRTRGLPGAAPSTCRAAARSMRRTAAGDFPADRHGAAARATSPADRLRRHRPATSRARRSSPPPMLGEGLARLQAGETDFDLGGGDVRPVLRHPARHAQRPARPAGVPARQEGEPARIDDDRAGRDAVRLHLRDQGSAGRHQGAARAPADPGAEGGDARRRVLRQEDPPVAAARQRARRRRASAGRR